MASVGLVTFGLFGALFTLTQYLQFSLGYSALQAGLRVLPTAGAIAIVAPLSTVLVRVVGTKVAVAAGLLIIGGGLWQISTASAATTFAGIVVGIIMLGVGAGLVIPSATESVMGLAAGRPRWRRIGRQRRVPPGGRCARGRDHRQPAEHALPAHHVGMDLGLEVGAAVAVAGMVIALLALPSRENGR